MTHEPRLGRPGCEKPVLKKIWAGAWLNWSVWTDLTRQMSSTTSARCGSISESSAPHWPCRANLNCGPEHGGVGADERVTLAADDRRRQRLAFELGQLAACSRTGRAGWGRRP